MSSNNQNNNQTCTVGATTVLSLGAMNKVVTRSMSKTQEPKTTQEPKMTQEPKTHEPEIKTHDPKTQNFRNWLKINTINTRNLGDADWATIGSMDLHDLFRFAIECNCFDLVEHYSTNYWHRVTALETAVQVLKKNSLITSSKKNGLVNLVTMLRILKADDAHIKHVVSGNHIVSGEICSSCLHELSDMSYVNEFSSVTDVIDKCPQRVKEVTNVRLTKAGYSNVEIDVYHKMSVTASKMTVHHKMTLYHK